MDWAHLAVDPFVGSASSGAAFKTSLGNFAGALARRTSILGLWKHVAPWLQLVGCHICVWMVRRWISRTSVYALIPRNACRCTSLPEPEPSICDGLEALPCQKDHVTGFSPCACASWAWATSPSSPPMPAALVKGRPARHRRRPSRARNAPALPCSQFLQQSRARCVNSPWTELTTLASELLRRTAGQSRIKKSRRNCI